MLIHTGDAFHAAHTRGYPSSPQEPHVRITDGSATAERLRRERHVRVYPEDESSWIYDEAVTDAASRRLAYVNGGHNPPMILRRGSDVIRLETGGPAVGLLPGCPYEQGVVQLQRGDVFLAFTDGISEAMNADDQEWGEDRLLACATRLNGCAREGIAQIMAAADEFVAGAKQYDDMTIVLAYLT